MISTESHHLLSLKFLLLPFKFPTTTPYNMNLRRRERERKKLRKQERKERENCQNGHSGYSIENWLLVTEVSPRLEDIGDGGGGGGLSYFLCYTRFNWTWKYRSMVTWSQKLTQWCHINPIRPPPSTPYLWNKMINRLSVNKKHRRIMEWIQVSGKVRLPVVRWGEEEEEEKEEWWCWRGLDTWHDGVKRSWNKWVDSCHQ